MSDTFTFLWKIENFSQLVTNNIGTLDCSFSAADALQSSKWRLVLHAYKGEFISCGLNRLETHSEKDAVIIIYDIQLLFTDGTRHTRKEKTIFYGDTDYIHELWVYDFLINAQIMMFPNDTIILEFNLSSKKYKPSFSKISMGNLDADKQNICTDEKLNKHTFPTKCTAVTQKRYTVWKIENFSTRTSSLFHWSPTASSYRSKLPMLMIAYQLTPRSAEEGDFYVFLHCGKLSGGIPTICIISVIDAVGNSRDSVTVKRHFVNDSNEVMSFPYVIGKDKLTELKDEYLPNDTLTLSVTWFVSDLCYESSDCCAFSPLLIPPTSADSTPDICEGFQQIYTDNTPCDLTIICGQKAFLVHSLVLAAKSPVFRRLLLEGGRVPSGTLEVNDVESDILSQMIAFVYFGSLETLDNERAPKLLEAADKYEIPSLRGVCTDFLECFDYAETLHKYQPFPQVDEPPGLDPEL